MRDLWGGRAEGAVQGTVEGWEHCLVTVGMGCDTAVAAKTD